jgi:hypothetical protein
VKRIRDKGEGVDGVTSDQFQQEESRINDQQDHNPVGFGEAHGGLRRGALREGESRKTTEDVADTVIPNS